MDLAVSPIHLVPHLIRVIDHPRCPGFHPQKRPQPLIAVRRRTMNSPVLSQALFFSQDRVHNPSTTSCRSPTPAFRPRIYLVFACRRLTPLKAAPTCDREAEAVVVEGGGVHCLF